MKKTSCRLVLWATLIVAVVSCNSDNSDEILQKSIEPLTSEPEFITLRSGTFVEKREDKYIWQDDILLSQIQYELLDETGDIIPSVPEEIGGLNKIEVASITGYDFVSENITNTDDIQLRSAAIYPTSYNLWAMVRFTYAKAGTGTTLHYFTKSLIKQALAHWEAKTNIRFYNATDEPTVVHHMDLNIHM
ncbi:MAG: hypothetical protein LBU03_06620 [Tannerellaceae bacterium]|jgi:hypothetical protein|nr:hypothetical protein [Tannerellaceae bacterium]